MSPVRSMQLRAAILLAVILIAAQMSWTGDAKRGSKIYERTCVVCHGANGKGAIPGTPDFVKGGRLEKDADTLLDNVKQGFQSPGSALAMPPRGGNPYLHDQDLKDALCYITSRFPDEPLLKKRCKNSESVGR